MVNIASDAFYSFPAVMTQSDGGYIITFQSPYDSMTKSGIFAQRYDSAGHKIGTKFQVSTDVSQVVISWMPEWLKPKIARLSDDGFVITWGS